MTRKTRERPRALKVVPDGIPEGLRDRPSWVNWRYGKDKQGNWTKHPYDPQTGSKASSTGPESWSAFGKVMEAYEAGHFEGIGYVFSTDDDFVGIDLDECRNPQTGELEEWAEKIVRAFTSYSEASPSGEGVHIIVRGFLPDGGRKRGGIEMYDSNRFFTITGTQLPGTPETVEERAGALASLHRKVFGKQSPDASRTHGGEGNGLSDAEVISRATRSKGGEKFKALWAGELNGHNSHSEADLDLAGRLAFWTGGDPRAVDRLFRQSGLMREKWDERRGARTYGQATIEKVLEGLVEVYEPYEHNGRSKRYAKAGQEGREDHRNPGVTASRPFRENYTFTPVRFAHREPPKPREFMVEGLVPKGHATTLFGDGGSAKSVLAMSLATAISGGTREWLGRKILNCPVLYLDFELDADEQHRRALQIARGAYLDGPPEDLLYVSGLEEDARAVLTGALQVCEAEGVGLVIVDSLGIALQGDAGSAADVIGFHRRCLDPFRAAGVTLLVIDHQGKAGAEGYQGKRAFGSVYKENLSRSVLQVEPGERQAGSLAAKLRQTKHNFGPKAQPFGVKLGFSEERITIDLEELDEADLATERTKNATDRVLFVLRDGPAFPDEIAETAEMPLGTVKNALSKLRKRGVIEDTGVVDPETRSRQVSRCNSLYREHDSVTPADGGPPSRDEDRESERPAAQDGDGEALSMEAVGRELRRQNSGPALALQTYLQKPCVTRLEWLTKAVLAARRMDTGDWERHAETVRRAADDAAGCS